MTSNLPSYIQALLNPDFYPYQVEQCHLLETHISWVILTGKYAYKVKKPVNFGFLNFETPERRKFFCHEELRLNQRIASNLYIEVLTLTEKNGVFSFDDNEEAVDYVLKMHQFPQQARFDYLVERNQLSERQFKDTAELLAKFHAQCPSAPLQSHFGTPAQVQQPVLENFQQIDYSSLDQSIGERLDKIKSWARTTYNGLQEDISQRKQEGYVRECHGDLHLSNLAWLNNQPIPFDCLEFNADLRWIDVISDIAFLVMDLHRCGRFQLAQLLLNRYLEFSGDYQGIKLLAYYLCYRAVVMAKVESLRLKQINHHHPGYKSASENFSTYLQLAERYTQTQKPLVIICHGLSASGKSTISEKLLPQLPAIKISSDIERKRIAEIWPDWQINSNKTSKPTEKDLYHNDMNKRVYGRLLELTSSITSSGYHVIVDATFLKTENRMLFFNFARQNQFEFVILNFIIPFDILRQRIIVRETEISDADLNVLEKQISNYQQLESSEKEFSIDIDAQYEVDINQLCYEINSHKSF